MNTFHFQKLEVNGIYQHLSDNLLPMYFLSIVCLPLLFLGAFLSNNIFAFYSTKNENKLLNNTILFENKFYKSYFFSFTIILIIILIVYVFNMYLSNLDTLPIMGLFIDDSNISELRSAATNDFSGKKYRYNLFLKTVPLFFFIIFFLIEKKSYLNYLFLIIFFVFSAFASVMDGLKGPIIQLFLLILMLYIFKEKKIPYKKLLIGFIISFVMLMLMYMFLMGMKDRDFIDILTAPFSRIFLGSSVPMIYYLEYIPKHVDYLLGTTFPNPAGIFPFEWRRITVELMEFAHPEIVKRGIVGSMPATFYGDFYANFSYFGALISMFLLGFILKTIDIIFIVSTNKRKLFLPIVSSFLIYINIAGTYSRTTYTGIFIDQNIIFVLFISFIIILLNQLYIKSRSIYAKKNNINSLKQLQKR